MDKSIKSLAELSEQSSAEDSDNAFSDVSDNSELGETARAAESKFSKKDPKDHPRKNLTGQDVRVAKETSDLFKSNVFKLEVDELLGEVKLEEKYITEANKTLHVLKDILFESDPIDAVQLKDTENLFQGSIPWPTHCRPTSDIQYSFAYTPPQVINVIGSWALHSATKCPETTGIDLYVEMPSSLFEAKDYLNYRYFHKRAFYLAAVGAIIAAHSKLDLSPRYQYIHSDPLRPILRLDFLSPKLRKRFHILLHLGVPASTFPERKLAEDRNCVRSTSMATPNYNNSILADQSHQALLTYVHEVSSLCPAFGDACKLGALWLRQRGGFPGFGRFEWTVLMAALLQGGHSSGKRVLLPGFSSYQLVKVTLLYSSTTDFLQLEVGKPSMPLDVIDEDDDKPRLMFGQWNILELFSTENAKFLQYEAKISVDMLNDNVKDHFGDLFLRYGGQLAQRTDFAFKVNLLPSSLSEWSADLWPSSQQYAEFKVSEILRQAWGSRVHAFVVKSLEEPAEWALASKPPAESLRVTFEVGAVIDPSQAARRVTLSDDGDQDFKSFWGEKTATRRFQDGVIREAVVWNSDTAITVMTEITQYILKKNFRGAAIKLSPNLESLVDNGSHFSTINTALQKLGQSLQGLKDTPLRISGVYGTSALCRYAALSGPQPYQCQSNDFAEAAIELESSRKWPTDIAAREKTKTAFLIRIAELIRQQLPSYSPLVGTDGAGVGFLLVQTPEGFHFRLLLATKYDSELRSKINHTRAIASLAQRYPALSIVMRIMKKWFQGQMIASHVREEAIELVACHPFLDSSPYAVPSSATSGFMRVMSFLSRWNWKSEPIIYDFSESSNLVTGCDLDITFYQTLMNSFSEQRHNDAAYTQAPWLIESRIDPTGILWTKNEPRSRVAPLIASRVTTLARIVTHMQELDIDNIFSPALQDFPVKLRVSPHLKPNIWKNEVLSDPLKAMAQARNPALSFFRDVQRAYSNSLILFSNFSIDEREESPNLVVAGIWNPAIDLTPSKFKPGTPYPTKETSQGLVSLDKNAIIQEICRLGVGIIKPTS